MGNYKTASLISSLIVASLLVGVIGCGVNKKKLRTLGAVILVGVAAKLIYDMVIDYQTQQTSNEGKVVNKYKKLHKNLPDEPVLVEYQTSIQPGEVVNVGKEVSIVSTLEVVRSVESKTVAIQEKITIYDNEDNSKALKSLVKTVNSDTNASGRFENRFTFKLPKGMPQGIYPVKTEVIVNGKAFQPRSSQMQLVDNSRLSGGNRLVASLK